MPIAPNINIISNEFNYDNGKAVSYKELITTLTKQEAFYKLQHKNGLTLQEQKPRSSIILIGDIPEDAKMVCDTKHNNIIRIGYLNHSEERMKTYIDNFDIVITGDGSLCPIVQLINGLHGNLQ